MNVLAYLPTNKFIKSSNFFISLYHALIRIFINLYINSLKHSTTTTIIIILIMIIIINFEDFIKHRHVFFQISCIGFSCKMQSSMFGTAVPSGSSATQLSIVTFLILIITGLGVLCCSYN